MVMMSITTQKISITDYQVFQDKDNTNIMLDNPYRYGLSDNSHMNKEIYTFNSTLKKIAKLFNYVTI
jgi:hypothetical protein